MAKRADLTTYRNDPRVESAWDEGEDGYWIELMPGWGTGDGRHCVHEWNAKDLKLAFKNIEPCRCEHECQVRLAKETK